LIVKSQFFSFILLVNFFGSNYNIGELTNTTSKEGMTANIIFFAGAAPFT